MLGVGGERVPVERHTHLHGGPAPVRQRLPELIDLIWSRRIDPGKVFGSTSTLGAQELRVR